MNKIIFFYFLLGITLKINHVFASSLDWNTLYKNESLQHEISWLRNNLAKDELNNVIDLVSALSQPEASQLLVSHLYLDGSFKRKSIKPYLAGLALRPSAGDAGIINVAYQVSKLRKSLLSQQKSSKFYTAQFLNSTLELPKFNNSDVNKNIKLSFDFQPAQVILDIIAKPDNSYQEIIGKLNLSQFNELITHRNQSFYPIPLTKERLATCLQIASSTKPIDQLYKYMNPYGLLNFTDIKQNLDQYKQQINTLKNGEIEILNFINARVAPYLPKTSEFDRKVSFFFINGADGWATDDVTAIDLNYYKDNYKKLLPLLVHETYHSGQSAVLFDNPIINEENTQSFINAIDALAAEGTATFVSPPSIKSKNDIYHQVKKGITLLENIYMNTVSNYSPVKAQDLHNKGIISAGPFYWLGAEMSKVIVNEMGKKKLAEIIPYGGSKFIKTYLVAVKSSQETSNIFSEALSQYVLTL